MHRGSCQEKDIPHCSRQTAIDGDKSVHHCSSHCLLINRSVLGGRRAISTLIARNGAGIDTIKHSFYTLSILSNQVTDSPLIIAAVLMLRGQSCRRFVAKA